MKKKIFYILLAFALVTSLLILLMNFLGIYVYTGGDYQFQTLPYIEYIRQNFYYTHDLFPQLNMNMGLIQSYLGLYYYGMYNPFVMVSILVPFIPTYLYTELLIIIIIISQFIIGYKIINEEVKNKYISLVGATLIGANGTIIEMGSYHTPFLTSYVGFLLMIYGIQKIFNKKSPTIFIVGTILVYLTNFTFILAFTFFAGIYLVYLILKNNESLSYLGKLIMHLAVYSLIGLMISAFVMLPSLISLTSGVREPYNVVYPLFGNSTSFISSVEKGLFGGVFTFAIIIMTFIYRKKEYLWLCFASLFTFVFMPLFHFLQLNQTDHVKAVYGSMALFIILFCNLISDVFNKKDNIYIYTLIMITLLIFLNTSFIIVSLLLIIVILLRNKSKWLKKYSFVISLIYIISLLMYEYHEYLIKDDLVGHFKTFINLIYMIILIAFIIAFMNKKKILYYIVPVLLIFSFFNFSIFRQLSNEFIVNQAIMDKNTDITDYDLYREKNEKGVRAVNIDDSTPDIYTSIENYHYVNHLYNTIDMQQYSIGIKANISQTKISSIIFSLNNEYNSIGEVRPIFYGTSNVYSSDSYLNIPNEYRLLMELLGVYSESSSESTPDVSGYLESLDVPDKLTLDGNEKAYYTVNNPFDSGELIIDFYIDPTACTKDFDPAITINEQVNTLKGCGQEKYNNNDHFTYYIPIESGEDIDVKLNEFVFKISDLKVKFISDDNIKSLNSDVTVPTNFSIDFNHGFKFNINMDKDGYIGSAIPYDKGYKITVDDQKVDSEICDEDYLCFPISKGTHDVEIRYTIPGFIVGMFITMITSVGYISYRLYLKRKISVDKS